MEPRPALRLALKSAEGGFRRQFVRELRRLLALRG